MPLRKTAHSSNQGFTLIEFLVAITIMMVGLMALLQCVNIAIVKNLENQFRHEAVALADERLAVAMAKPFASISSSLPDIVGETKRPINNAFKSYSVVRRGSTIPAGLKIDDDAVYSKVVNVRVSWRHKGLRYEHTMSGMASRSISNSPNVR